MEEGVGALSAFILESKYLRTSHKGKETIARGKCRGVVVALSYNVIAVINHNGLI